MGGRARGVEILFLGHGRFVDSTQNGINGAVRLLETAARSAEHRGRQGARGQSGGALSSQPGYAMHARYARQMN